MYYIYARSRRPWSGVSSNMLAFFARHVYIVCTMRVCVVGVVTSTCVTNRGR